MFNESINIQKKIFFEFICFFYSENIFDKIVDIFRGTKRPIMCELGLEFLRIYDGKFNYQEGHKV
jgi:hypothetical protein